MGFIPRKNHFLGGFTGEIPGFSLSSLGGFSEGWPGSWERFFGALLIGLASIDWWTPFLSLYLAATAAAAIEIENSAGKTQEKNPVLFSSRNDFSLYLPKSHLGP